MPSPEPDAERVARRRGQIARAAERLMARDGFHAMSMQALAAEAGVSVGLIYTYVKGKEDLLLLVLTDVLEEFGRDLPEAIAAHDDPVEALAAGFRAYCRVIGARRPAAVLAYRETATLDRAGRERVKQLEVDTARPLVEVIRHGQQSGAFRPDVPAELAAHDLVVLAQAWALKHWHFAPLTDLDGFIENQLALVLGGLRRQQGDPR